MGNWLNDKASDLVWCRAISSRDKKEAIAKKLSSRLQEGDVVGVGSGSTSFLTLLELSKCAEENSLNFTAIVTSIEMERVCAALRIPTSPLSHFKPDWSFDGADEIDPEGRMIKGRGGALFREKLVMVASAERYIVVDDSKLVSCLGERFAIPFEVVPDAVDLVREQLVTLGAREYAIRQAVNKDGPIITEFGGLILDVKFEGKVPSEQALESLPGVLATGLFDRWDYKRVSVE